MSNQITPNPSVPTQVVAEVKFPRWINNLGIIPTSYKDSMSYYECLAWLCKFLEETVIPSVNENGEAVQELQNLYEELKDLKDAGSILEKILGKELQVTKNLTGKTARYTNGAIVGLKDFLLACFKKK